MTSRASSHRWQPGLPIRVIRTRRIAARGVAPLLLHAPILGRRTPWHRAAGAVRRTGRPPRTRLAGWRRASGRWPRAAWSPGRRRSPAGRDVRRVGGLRRAGPHRGRLLRRGQHRHPRREHLRPGPRALAARLLPGPRHRRDGVEAGPVHRRRREPRARRQDPRAGAGLGGRALGGRDHRSSARRSTTRRWPARSGRAPAPSRWATWTRGQEVWLVTATPVEVAQGHRPAARAVRRARHGGRERRRRLHRPPGRRAAARAGQGRGGRGAGAATRAWTCPGARPTPTRPTTSRCSRSSATRARSTPTRRCSSTPGRTAGRSWTTAGDAGPRKLGLRAAAATALAGALAASARRRRA